MHNIRHFIVLLAAYVRHFGRRFTSLHFFRRLPTAQVGVSLLFAILSNSFSLFLSFAWVKFIIIIAPIEFGGFFRRQSARQKRSGAAEIDSSESHRIGFD